MDSETDNDFQESVERILELLVRYAEEVYGIAVIIHTDPRYERRYNFILYDSYKEGKDRTLHGSRGWIYPHQGLGGGLEWEISLAIDDGFDKRMYGDILEKYLTPVHAIVKTDDPRPIFQVMFTL